MTSPEFGHQNKDSKIPPDPFIQDTVYFNTPEGKALNFAATAKQYDANFSVPHIDAESLKIGDRLIIEFEGQASQEYAIEDTVVSSMSFGSDDVRSPQLTIMVANGERAGERVRLVGSSISPGGTTLAPNIVRVGMYLSTSWGNQEQVSKGVIVGFSVKRRAEDGQYIEVPLNHQGTIPQESRSFIAFNKDYEDLIGILSDKGFKFGDLDENGLSAAYRKLNDHTVVYASNQGFGCGVTPQHEAYMYSADKQRLIGMRYLPTKQIAQMVIIQGVTPELYAQETFAYNTAGELDWRQLRDINPSSLHRMASHSHVPLVTYTWRNGSVEKPTITVKANAGVEGMQQIDGVTEYEVTVTQEDTPLVWAAQPGWWVENPEQYKAIEVANTVLSDSDGQAYNFSFANVSIIVAKDPSPFRAELVQAFRRS